MFETDFKEILPVNYWDEILRQHTHRSRHYHSFQHLESIWQQLQPVKADIQDWPVIVCAIAYHDFVYSVQKSNNEEKSAGHAQTSMTEAGFLKDRIDRCYRHIIATKGHTVSEDPDTNYFTDADLSILGSDPDIYRRYTENIRKEYRIYPSFVYKPGRKKVLQHFLHLPRIFKTDHFSNLYEDKARKNIETELTAL